MVLACGERVCGGAVVFVSHHHIDVVLPYLLRIVQYLLSVEFKLPLVPLGDEPLFAGELSEVRVVDICRAGLIQGNASIYGELEVFQERNVEISCSVECVSFGLLCVQLVV